MKSHLLIYFIISLVHSGLVFAATNGPTWSEVEAQTLPPVTAFSKKIPLHFVVLKGSSWTNDVVETEIRGAEKVFAQCGVTFFPITVARGKSIYGVDVSARNDEIFLKDGAFPKRPLVIFAEKETSGLGSSYSWNKSTPNLPPIEVNTSFLFYENYLANKSSPLVDPNYNVLAHELAHLLFDADHNDIQGNILCGRYDCKGTAITREQCNSIVPSFFTK